MRLLHSWNAWSPILVTLLGMVIWVSPVQSLNASSPMAVISLPMMTVLMPASDFDSSDLTVYGLNSVTYSVPGSITRISLFLSSAMMGISPGLDFAFVFTP